MMVKQIKRMNPWYDEAMEDTSIEQMNIFIKEYNRLFNVPANKASETICQKYKIEHPNEFKTSDWSIDKHRKRFMDWMSKQSPETLKL
jgi:DNA primase